MEEESTVEKEERFCIDETLKHINRVRHHLASFLGKLFERGTYHDKSKLEEPEFSGFVEYTPKLKDSTYGSDEYKEFLKGMKPFLDHHYKFNPHHPEAFENGMEDMSLVDITETLADWKSATERHHDGDIRKSIELNQERFGYPDFFKKILLNTVEEMGW